MLWNNCGLPDPILSNFRSMRFIAKWSTPRRGQPLGPGAWATSSAIVEMEFHTSARSSEGNMAWMSNSNKATSW